MEYLGHLPDHDPLYDYLCREVMPQLGGYGGAGFRVFSCCSSHAVYIYEDRGSGRKVVGKFFAANGCDFDRAKKLMYRERDNIRKFRSLLGKSHYAARELGCCEKLNCLLVTEYCYGEALDSIILRAINHGDDGILFDKLTALGDLLATVHNHSARPVKVDFQRICRYFDTIVTQLESISDRGERDYLHSLCNKFRRDPFMYLDQEVSVHGDATPANFFFGDGHYVITFDLERMQRSDRLFDVGRIAGELQHFFLFHTRNKYRAEPFIGHFMWEYCTHFPDRERAFASVTGRLPFYMGLTLLRIARNDYLPPDYRRKLIGEAKLTLCKRS